MIGVADNGEVVGLEPDYRTLSKRPDRDGYQQFLVNLISSHLGKNYVANLAISFQPLQGKEVCVVRASAASTAAYSEDGGQSRLHVGLGNTSLEMSGREAVDYVQSRWPKSR